MNWPSARGCPAMCEQTSAAFQIFHCIFLEVARCCCWACALHDDKGTRRNYRSGKVSAMMTLFVSHVKPHGAEPSRGARVTRPGATE
jgi:hypothetical protein